jgi:glycosyltransferase involved in cell wall biosynthesis
LLVDAATELQARGHDDIAFLLVGQGKQAEAVGREVERRGLHRVVFAGSLPRRDVALVLQASHACAVLFKNLPVLATNSPNKLFDALAAGRAVIVNSDGWTRRLVEEHGVGVYAEPGSAAALAERILWLSRHPETCADMGRRARRLAERDFDRLELAGRFEAVLRASTGGLPGPPAAAPPAAPPVAPPARRRDPAPADAEAHLAEPAGMRRRL